VEETINAGRLLFSTDKYDQEALVMSIWEFISVKVALCYRDIDDRKPKEYPQTKKKRTPVKALHIKIDMDNQATSQNCLETLYSSKAIVFLLGIKMQLVWEYKQLTNLQAKAKAEGLQAHQEWFLAQMQMCMKWETTTLDLMDQSTEATLWQLIMNIPDPANTKCHVFHVVNKMFLKEGFIFCFHPVYSQNAQDIIAGLVVNLKGLWHGVIKTAKFNIIFTDMALDRAKDAWWDAKTKCIMTQADEEMMNILTQDKNLIVMETKVQIDLSGKQKEGKQTSSSQTQFNINRINLYFPYDSNTEHQSNT